ncbi:hypothetical protein ACS0TY_023234 [Phlomoides rotata]
MWNTEKFQQSSAWETRGILVVNGVWLADGSRCTLINVYAPHDLRQKWELWDNIATVAEQHKDSCVGIIGDFNAIRDPSE